MSTTSDLTILKDFFGQLSELGTQLEGASEDFSEAIFELDLAWDNFYDVTRDKNVNFVSFQEAQKRLQKAREAAGVA